MQPKIFQGSILGTASEMFTGISGMSNLIFIEIVEFFMFSFVMIYLKSLSLSTLKHNFEFSA